MAKRYTRQWWEDRINEVTLIGRLGADAEIKETSKGDKYARLSLATNQKYKKGDEWQEKTEWHKIVVFDPILAQMLERTGKKGEMFYIKGEITTRSFESDTGTKWITEINVPRFRGAVKRIGLGGGASGDTATQTVSPSNNSTKEEVEDIPF